MTENAIAHAMSACLIRSRPEFPDEVLGEEAALASVQEVLRVETHALITVQRQLPGQAAALSAVCDLIRLRCAEGLPGRLVLTGIGKAGKIADKLAATFASTGTPSLFLHPAEARHGDLGMVGRHDVVMALSNSGASEEVVELLPAIRRIGAALVALVGKRDSPLAHHADHVLTVGEVAEACPLGLAPSASTTALLALGDALALTIQRQRRFTPAQYARYHPGGALGRKLMTCAEVMRVGERLPLVGRTATVMDCLKTITRVRAGCVLIVDDDRRAVGLFTDGDLRRLLASGAHLGLALDAPILPHANRRFIAVAPDDLASRAAGLCVEKKINQVPVLEEGITVGLIDLQDIPL